MPQTKFHFQRFEFKYYLPHNTADKIIPALLNYMDWDPYIKNSHNDYYQVNSLYFDSPDYGCFADKESGIADRKKLRFRFYEPLQPASPIFLEIKRKKDALIIKDRIKLTSEFGASVNLDNYLKSLYDNDKDNKFLRELIWFKKRNNLRPKLFISYCRKALMSKVDPRFRLTFDYNIKTALINNLAEPPARKLLSVYPYAVVLELKYNNILPNWFHHIIQKFQLQRLAYSKYFIWSSYRFG